MNEMTRIDAAPAVRTVEAGPARFSTAEFERMIATGALDDMKIELVEGELQRMPPPGNNHSRLQAGIVIRLASVAPEALVQVALGIELGEGTVVGADAAILRRPIEDDGRVAAANVLLAVEVAVATTDRDLGLKRRLYAAAGVPTYWVIDADRRVTHVFDRPEGADYRGLALVRFGDALAVPGAEGAVVVG